jgi:hypothetical protein
MKLKRVIRHDRIHRKANVALDGKQQNFTAISIGDSLVLHFVNPHRTHYLSIKMQENAVPEFSTPFVAVLMS